MSLRRRLGVAGALTYLGMLVYVSAGAQCPVGPETGCAKVHALMLTARPPVPPRPMFAAPMRANRVADVLRLAGRPFRGATHAVVGSEQRTPERGISAPRSEGLNRV